MHPPSDASHLSHNFKMSMCQATIAITFVFAVLFIALNSFAYVEYCTFCMFLVFYEAGFLLALRRMCIHRASLLNHSCQPNCALNFLPTGGLEVRTIREVSAGDPLHISYIDCAQALAYRQEDLRNFYFDCSCQRCTLGVPPPRLRGRVPHRKDLTRIRWT
jgi:hypothetical protein